jgi:hypothetical protein
MRRTSAGLGLPEYQSVTIGIHALSAYHPTPWPTRRCTERKRGDTLGVELGCMPAVRLSQLIADDPSVHPTPREDTTGIFYLVKAENSAW